jgi:hypothetical protein
VNTRNEKTTEMLGPERQRITGHGWPGPGCRTKDCQVRVTPFYPNGYLAQAGDEAAKKERERVVKFFGQDPSRVCCCCLSLSLSLSPYDKSLSLSIAQLQVPMDHRYLIQIGHKYW